MSNAHREMVLMIVVLSTSNDSPCFATREDTNALPEAEFEDVNLH